MRADGVNLTYGHHRILVRYAIAARIGGSEMRRSAGSFARKWILSGCAGLLALAAGAKCTHAQTAPAVPPQGLKLQVAETAVDLTSPSDVVLHVQLVNGSQRTVTVWPGKNSLLAADEGLRRRCDNPPDPSARPTTAAKVLRPGDTYSEMLTLNMEVCRGLLQAKAVQVERPVLIGNGIEVSVRSQPITLQGGRSAEQDIRSMLTRQTADWNRGDIGAFASGYKNSPDILFIGRKISRGYEQMLATYKQGYPTHDAMGALTFSQLEVQPLDPQFATVTGYFHLERTQAGGGNADGYFLLVVENTASGWKIVRDDTTALPPPAAR